MGARRRKPRNTRAPVRPKLSRRARKDRTRQRILDAAVDIVRNDGIEGVTTVRLAQAAGITQPGFYVHFPTVNRCLEVAVEQVCQRLADLLRESRHRVYARVERPEDVGRPDLVAASYADTLELFLSEPKLADLFLRLRRDPSRLGKRIREIRDRVHADMTEELARVPSRLGIEPASRADLALFAEVVLALFYGMAEALLDERIGDRDAAVRVLTRATLSIMASQPGDPAAPTRRARRNH